MEHELEASVLKLQKDGLRLYGALAEFYFWLGYRKMGDILQDKFMTLARRNMETRRRFVEETGEMIAPAGKQEERSGASSPAVEPPKTYRLQWQEGTMEPEDEPNISNGVDVLPKNPPTRQPWEELPSGSSGNPPEGAKERDAMYDASLDRWLSYETEAVGIYGKMMEHHKQEDLWQTMRDEAMEETGRLRDN